jgi:hypothetical protein
VSLLNNVVEFCKVISSGLSGPSSAVHMNVSGAGGFAFDADGQITGADASDEGGEQAHEQEVYQSLGIIGRPLPPDGDAFAEALTLRTGDGLLPFAFRDLRLHRALNAAGAGSVPREGQLFFVGYGGAFVSHALTESNVGSKRANVTTIYCPHDFDGSGVPQKAHAITLDPRPGKSSVSVAHASGLFLALTEDTGNGPGIVASVDGSTFFRMSAGEVTIQATKIMLRGNCYLGAQADAGVPLFGGPISPQSPSVFVSPV